MYAAAPGGYPQRPLSGSGSVSTMATADLPARPRRDDERYSSDSRPF